MGSLYIQSCATYLKACQNGCYAKYGILWKENLLLWTSTFHLYSYFKFCKSCCWLNRGLCSIFFRHQIFLLLFVYYLYYEYLSKIFGKISNIYFLWLVFIQVAGAQGWDKGVDYIRMDGSTSAQNRKEWTAMFNDEENVKFVFSFCISFCFLSLIYCGLKFYLNLDLMTAL